MSGSPERADEEPLDARIDQMLVRFDKWRRSKRGRSNRRPVRVLVFWPQDQWPAMADRWPQFVAEYGDDFETHRRTIRDMLRLHAEDDDVALGIAELTVDGLAEYAEAMDSDPADSETRAAYAAALGRTGTFVTWPPGPRDACWCGSEIPYATCCGA